MSFVKLLEGCFQISSFLPKIKYVNPIWQTVGDANTGGMFATFLAKKRCQLDFANCWRNENELASSRWLAHGQREKLISFEGNLYEFFLTRKIYHNFERHTTNHKPRKKITKKATTFRAPVTLAHARQGRGTSLCTRLSSIATIGKAIIIA
jgi:hypothetical protein